MLQCPDGFNPWGGKNGQNKQQGCEKAWIHFIQVHQASVITEVLCTGEGIFQL